MGKHFDRNQRDQRDGAKARPMAANAEPTALPIPAPVANAAEPARPKSVADFAALIRRTGGERIRTRIERGASEIYEIVPGGWLAKRYMQPHRRTLAQWRRKGMNDKRVARHVAEGRMIRVA